MPNNLRYLSSLAEELNKILFILERDKPINIDVQDEISILNTMIQACGQLIFIERRRLEVFADSIADVDLREVFRLSAINGLGLNEISALLGFDVLKTYPNHLERRETT